jgi:hypothetical protein
MKHVHPEKFLSDLRLFCLIWGQESVAEILSKMHDLQNRSKLCMVLLMNHAHFWSFLKSLHLGQAFSCTILWVFLWNCKIAVFSLAPSNCKYYGNICGLTLTIGRMPDVPTSLSNHLLLIVTFHSSSPSKNKWTICGVMVTTVAGWTCGAGNKQQSDVYEENIEETKHTSEEMKKHR